MDRPKFSFVLIFVLNFGVSLSQNKEVIDSNSYTQNDGLFVVLRELSDKFPLLSMITSVGKTAGGSEIHAIHISDNVNVSEPGEPYVKFIANIHGNEPTGREILLSFSKFLLENYESGVTRQAVDSLNIIIIPAINLDGFEEAVEGECDDSTGMLNKNDIDINADFSLDSDEYQPETKVRIAFFKIKTFFI